MKSRLIKQALYDLRTQPVIGVVTIIGTALSIFLIMIIVMTYRVDIMPVKPEVNRERTLYGRHLHLKSINEHGESSAGISPRLAERFYGNLQNTEATSLMSEWMETVDVTAKGANTYLVYRHVTDHNFWRVFDFDFIAGKPYDEAAFKAGLAEVVLTESLARKLFRTIDVVGREVLVKQTPYRVVGVVEDVSPLSKTAFAEIYYPFTSSAGKEDVDGGWDEHGEFGGVQAIIVANSASDFPEITKEVQARMKAFSSEVQQRGDSVVYHGQPYTQEESIYASASNQDSSEKEQRKSRWIIYAVLLLVPAINLSSMTQSRLRRRVSEFGVRRAFGCRKSTIIANIIAENFVITLIGALVGLVLCFVFGYFFTDMIFTDVNVNHSVSLSIKMLIDWKLYATAILFCFLLNLLSSGIPAWRASRVNPVDAINNR